MATPFTQRYEEDNKGKDTVSLSLDKDLESSITPIQYGGDIQGQKAQAFSKVLPRDYLEIEEVTKLNTLRDNTGTETKIREMMDISISNSLVTDFIKDNITKALYPKDENYKLAGEDIFNSFSTNKLPFNNDVYEQLLDSESAKESEHIMHLYKQGIEKQKKSATILNEYQYMAAIATGEMADPAILALGPALFVKSASASVKLSALSEALNVAGEEITNTYQDIGMDERLAGSVAGIGFEMAINRMTNVIRGVKNEMPLTKIDEPIISEQEMLLLPRTTDIGNKDVFQANIDLNNRLKSNIEPITEEVIQQERVWFTAKPSFNKEIDAARKTMQTEIDEIDSMIAKATEFETSILPSRYEEQTVYAEMREKASIYRNQLDDKLNAISKAREYEIQTQQEMSMLRKMGVEEAIIRLDNNEYLPEYVKKSMKRQLQKATGEDVKINKLEALGKREKEINDRVSELNKKIGSYKRNTIHKQKAIDELDNLAKEKANIQNTTKQVKDGRSIPNEERQKIKKAERDLEIAGMTLHDLKPHIEELRTLVNKSNVEQWRELQVSVDVVSKKYPNMFNSLKQDIGNLLAQNDKAKLNSTLLNKLPTNKKLVVLGVASALGATGANASEGNDEASLNAITGLVLFMLLGATTAIALKGKTGTIATKFKNTMNGIHSNHLFDTGEEGTKMQLWRTKMLSYMYSGDLLARYQSIAKFGGEAKAYADKILSQAFSGNKMSAELDKDISVRGAYATIGMGIDKYFTSYLESSKLYSKLTNWANDIALKDKFGKAVADAMEGSVSNIAGVNEMAKILRTEMDKAMDLLKEAMPNINPKLIDNYLPRHWYMENIRDAIRMNPENEGIILNKLTNAIIKGNADKTVEKATEEAEALLKHLTRVGSEDGKSFTLADDFLSQVEEFLDASVDIKDVQSKITTRAQDMMSSLKARKNLDLDELEDMILLDKNGEPLSPVGKDWFVDRDAVEVAKQYIHSVYAQTAMAKQGIMSKRDFMTTLGRVRAEQGDEAYYSLREAGFSVYGISDYDRANKSLTSLVRAMSLIGSGFMLSKSVFTAVRELGSGLLTSPLGVSVVSMRRIAKGLNNPINERLIRESGLGSSQIRGVLSERFHGNVQEQELLFNTNNGGIIDSANLVGQLFIKAVVQKMGLGWLSDYAQALNVNNNATQLARFIETGKGLDVNRLSIYGLDEDTIVKMKGMFKLDNNNQIESIAEWTTEQRDLFRGVFRKITNEATPEIELGTTPVFQNSDLGRAIAPLTRYTINAFNAQGAVDIVKMDKRALLINLGGFVGALLGLSARAELTNSKATNEDIIIQALMQSNFMSIIPLGYDLFTGDNGAYNKVDDLIQKNAIEISKIYGGGEKDEY